MQAIFTCKIRLNDINKKTLIKSNLNDRKCTKCLMNLVV